eukprot:Sspe_Gene.14064::Locus_4858_Transcript_1_1_Confidence_1.000_Length_4234::g.14064::m.14064
MSYPAVEPPRRTTLRLLPQHLPSTANPTPSNSLPATPSSASSHLRPRQTRRRRFRELLVKTDVEKSTEMGEAEGLLARHGVLHHERSKEPVSPTRHSPANPRRGASIVGRDAAVVLLQLLQPRLESIKSQLGKKRHTKEEMVKYLAGEAAELHLEQSVGGDSGGRLLRSLESTVRNGFNPIAHESQVEAVVRAADCSGTGKVSWEEVLNFMIDAGMAGRTADALEMVKEYGEVLSHHGQQLQGISAMRWSEERTELLVCDRGSQLKWLSPMKDFACTSPAISCPSSEARGPATFISFDYIQPFGCVAAACGDLSLILFDADSGEMLQSERLDATSTCVRFFSSARNRLFSGDRNGALIAWRISSTHHKGGNPTRRASAGSITFGVTPEMTALHKTMPHTASITGMAWVEQQGCLVTSSLDHTICISSLTGEVVQRLKGHRSPVTCVVFADDANLLISAGQEGEPHAWRLSSTSETAKPFLLSDPQKPHTSAVISLAHVPSAHQVISADSRGLVKLWSLRMFECLQTLQCGQPPGVINAIKQAYQFSSLKSMVYLPNIRHIVACSASRVWFFEYDVVGGGLFAPRQSADDSPVLAVCFNPADSTVVTASSRNVKIWSLASGKILTRYDGASETDMTSFSISEDGLHYFVGSHEGSLVMHNMASGKPQRSIPNRHTAEVTSITPCHGRQCVLTTGWDGSVFLSAIEEDRVPRWVEAGGESAAWAPRSSTAGTPPHLRHMAGKVVDGKCCAFSGELNLCVVGDNRDSITLWSVPPGPLLEIKPVAKCQADVGRGGESAVLREVTAVAFVKGYPACVAGSSFGHIYVWSLPPFPYPYQCLAWWRNESPGKKERDGEGDAPRSELVGVTALCLVFGVRDMLYCADEGGFVGCYNIGHLLSEYNIAPLGEQQPGQVPHPDPSNHTVHCIKKWRAHIGNITSMAVVHEKNLIVTAGMDRQVSVWSLGGVLLGSLDQHGTAPFARLEEAGAPWDIPDSYLDPPAREPQSPSFFLTQKQSGTANDSDNERFEGTVDRRVKLQPKYTASMGQLKKKTRRKRVGQDDWEGTYNGSVDGRSLMTETVNGNGLTRKASVGSRMHDMSVKILDVQTDMASTVMASPEASPLMERPPPPSRKGSLRSLRLPSIASDLGSVATTTARKTRSAGPSVMRPPGLLPRSESAMSIRHRPDLPDDYLSLLSESRKSVAEGPTPSTVTCPPSPGDALLSPSKAALAPGSQDYYQKMKSFRSDRVEVEVNDRLTGRSRVVVMDRKPPRPSSSSTPSPSPSPTGRSDISRRGSSALRRLSGFTLNEVEVVESRRGSLDSRRGSVDSRRGSIPVVETQPARTAQEKWWGLLKSKMTLVSR